MFLLGYVSVYTSFILHCISAYILYICALCSHVIISRSYYLVCVLEILQLNFSCSELLWLFNCESRIRETYTVKIHCLIYSGLTDCFTLSAWAKVKITFHHVTVLQYAYHCPRVDQLTLCSWWYIISGSHEHLLSLPSVCGYGEEADCTYICTCIQTQTLHCCHYCSKT